MHVGEEKLGRLARRAIPGMHRAGKALLKNCGVEPAKSSLRPIVSHAQKDSVRMKEPLDGSALTVKLRVRRHTENGAAAWAVNRQKALQLFAGLNVNGPALDEEFRRLYGPSDRPCGGVQVRALRLAAAQQ